MKTNSEYAKEIQRIQFQDMFACLYKGKISVSCELISIPGTYDPYIIGQGQQTKWKKFSLESLFESGSLEKEELIEWIEKLEKISRRLKKELKKEL